MPVAGLITVATDLRQSAISQENWMGISPTCIAPSGQYIFLALFDIPSKMETLLFDAVVLPLTSLNIRGVSLSIRSTAKPKTEKIIEAKHHSNYHTVKSIWIRKDPPMSTLV